MVSRIPVVASSAAPGVGLPSGNGCGETDWRPEAGGAEPPPRPCECASRAKGEGPATEAWSVPAGRPREGSISMLMLRGPTSAYLTAVLSYKGPYKTVRRQGPTSRTKGPTETPRGYEGGRPIRLCGHGAGAPDLAGPDSLALKTLPY